MRVRLAVKIEIVYSLISLSIMSCQSTVNTVNEAPQSNSFGTELLGNQFLITIPCNYRIYPHYGVDYENYSLVPNDTLVNDPGTAGIIVGNNVGAIGAFIEKRNWKDTLASTILGRNVDWIVYDLDTVLFAECFVEGDFCAAIESKSRNEIHQFIKVLESLREK